MFPVGGIDRKSSFSLQEQQTAYDTLNVLPQDTIMGRVRGGSRPGMEKHYNGLVLYPGTPIRAIGQLTKADGTPLLYAAGGGYMSRETSAGVWNFNTATGFGTSARICHCITGDKAFLTAVGAVQPVVFDAALGSIAYHGNPPASPLGDVPNYCSIVAMIGDRLVFSGDSSAPRAYYMSRSGDYNDFAYGDTDDDRAVTGFLSVGGVNSDAITAVIPWFGDYSVWCCKSSMSVLVGDNPVTGAYFLPISGRLGSLDSMSWCFGEGRSLFIMTREGVAALDPGNPRAEPKLISQEKMPREMLAIAPSTYEVTLAWDSRSQLIHIFISKTVASAGVDHWALSLRTGGFFRMRYATDHEPLSAFAYPTTSSTSTNILLGCRDGYIRRFSNSSATDDGTNFDSYVMMGPLRPSGTEHVDSRILELVGIMATGSGTVDCDILPAATAELSTAASSLWNAELSAGRSPVHRPRVRCGNAIIKVTGTPGSAWSKEKLGVVVGSGGRQR